MLGKINIQLCSAHTALTLPGHTCCSPPPGLTATGVSLSPGFAARCGHPVAGEPGTWRRRDGERPSLTHRSLQNQFHLRGILKFRDPYPRAWFSDLQSIHWYPRISTALAPLTALAADQSRTGSRGHNHSLPSPGRGCYPAREGAGWGFHYIPLPQGKLLGAERFSSTHIPNWSHLPSCPEGPQQQEKAELPGWDPAPVEWPLLAARAWGPGRQGGTGRRWRQRSSWFALLFYVDK